MKFKLVIGDKIYSTWSLRPWLLLKYFNIPFAEAKIKLRDKNTKINILKFSPSGKIPCLIYGKIKIWDSLSICEFLAEKFKNKNLWPKDNIDKIMARNISSEMHSGFPNLRKNLSMNFLGKNLKFKNNKETSAEITRAKKIIEDCLKKSKGPFMFKKFSIADAMYAPVMFRFKIYNIKLSLTLEKYLSTLLSMKEIKLWLLEARKELK
jgi:glutathione S-transferase